MADRICVADGNLTDAATWATVDTTSKLDSEAGTTTLTTSYVESSGFTPGAITIDGIAVKVSSRSATPSGTMSVRIAQGGALVAGTEVTIDVADLQTRDQGWIFFKFSAPVTLLAATAYTLSAKTSVAAMVALFRNATAANYARLLRTTTTGAPAAGDDLYILGEKTAAGAETARTVTMNSTATTDYGSGSTSLPGFVIGDGGTLTWGVTAATTYILRLSTMLAVYLGGTLNMGTVATPVPRDSVHRLEFDCAADGDFGLRVYGTLVAQGQSRSSGKNVVQCLLNTDEAAGQTTLGVDTDTGWLSGDEIAIASTTQTCSQAELRVLNGDAGAASMDITVALTNAHSGTSPIQAEVINITRNVRILSVSTSFMAFVYFGVACTVDCDWVQFRYLGGGLTGERGIEIDTATGSVALSFCAGANFDNHGIYCNAADWANVSIDNFVAWSIGHQAAAHASIRFSETTGGNWTLTNVTLINPLANQGISLYLGNYNGNLSNVRLASGGGDGLQLAGGTSTHVIPSTKTWSGLVIHSHQQAGIESTEIHGGKISSVDVWRCSLSGKGGIRLATGTFGLVLETGNFFGNNTANVLLLSAAGMILATFRGIAFSGDSTHGTARGLSMPNAGAVPAILRFENCSMGVATGIKVAHSTADVDFGSSVDRWCDVTFVNTPLASATEFANESSLRGDAVYRIQRRDGTTNDHRTVYPALGTISYETTTFRTASPSEKLAPASASAKLKSGIRRVAVVSGGTVTIGAYVRKSAAYNGNAPRLVMKANPALGIDADTVIDTLSVAADVWEQLAGVTAAVEEDGVLEFYVDGDGTAGEVFVDDWSAA